MIRSHRMLDQEEDWSAQRTTDWHIKWGEDRLNRIRVFCAKFGSVSSGVRNLFDHAPATVIELSCPSLAVCKGINMHGRYREQGGKHTHIRRDEHPLRQRIRLEILIKQCEILALGQSFWITRHRIITHQRTVTIPSALILL